MTSRLLAGDLGGTKTLLLLAKTSTSGLQQICTQCYASADFTGLSAMVTTFLRDANQPAAALTRCCFGVAGPVYQGERHWARITNLPWIIDSKILAEDTGIPAPVLINDFEAVGYGLAELSSKDLHPLKSGMAIPKGNRAILGAGTGLGQALVITKGKTFVVVATQGGHVDFAPTNNTQIRLWQYLRQTQPRVSYEDVLSGPGLTRILRFLEQDGEIGISRPLAEAMTVEDPAAAIHAAALHGVDPLAKATLQLFTQIYGTQAGNLALNSNATAGIYLAGGIAPKIIKFLCHKRFSQAFLQKGPMQEFLKDIPVWVITNPNVGLLGAALRASETK